MNNHEFGKQAFCESEKGAEQILCFGIDTLKEGSDLQVLKQKGKYGLENIINWTSKQMWYVPKWCLQPVQIWTKENVSEIFAILEDGSFCKPSLKFDYHQLFFPHKSVVLCNVICGWEAQNGNIEMKAMTRGTISWVVIHVYMLYNSELCG